MINKNHDKYYTACQEVIRTMGKEEKQNRVVGDVLGEQGWAAILSRMARVDLCMKVTSEQRLDEPCRFGSVWGRALEVEERAYAKILPAI